MTVTASGDTITTSDDVQAAIVAALIGKTGAGANVFNPRDWPTKLGDLPMLMIQAPREHKDSQGANAPAYNVATTIRVIGRLTGKALDDGAAAGVLLTALGVLQRQIETAVINNYALYKIISEIQSVDVASEVKSEGSQPIGEVTMDFVCLFYQGPEAFAQPDLTPIEALALYADCVNVFDPNGTYDKPFNYPVAPAPRAAGPDGRVEGVAVVNIST